MNSLFLVSCSRQAPKIIYGDVTIQRDGNNSLRFGSANRITTTKYRHALESAIRHREPIFIALDEAQHLLDMAGLELEDIMDWLKSLANMTKTLFILFGTYSMYELLDLSDQLMSRSRIIHLRRYKKEGDDLVSFQATILAFQRNMPFPKEPDLLRHWEYLYERSVGCVGNLRNWLLAAYAEALGEGGKTLTLGHLKQCRIMSLKRAAKMDAKISVKETQFYKEIYDDEAADEGNLTDDAGVETKDVESTEGETSISKSAQKKRRAKRTYIGQRNPVRDKTGQNKKIA